MTGDYIDGIISKYHQKGIIIDTNLLILLIVGSLGEEALSRCKLTKSSEYKYKDFLILEEILKNFKNIIITPHILSEISHHLIKDNSDNSEIFRAIISKLSNIVEEHVKKDIILSQGVSVKLGIIDGSITELCLNKKIPVITDDGPLSGFLGHLGVEHININHIRFCNILSQRWYSPEEINGVSHHLCYIGKQI